MSSNPSPSSSDKTLMIRDSESLRAQVCKFLDKDAMLKPKELCELMNLNYNESSKTLTTYKTYWKALHGIKTDYAEEYRSKRNLRSLTVIEVAYIAGIIDGEGCLRVYGRPEAKTGRNFGVRLQITNTNGTLIDWLHSKIGGFIYGKAKRKANEQPIFNLTLDSNGCRWLLPQIRGFAIVKARQIAIVMRALDLIKTGKTPPYHEVKLLQAEIWQLNGQRRTHK